MVPKIEAVNTIRKIDTILHKPKNRAYLESDYAKIHPEKPYSKMTNNQSNEFSNEQLNELVEEAKEIMNRVNRQMTFKIHESTGRSLVQLVDRETNEVVREIPPEKMLDVIAGIWQWAGLMVVRKE